jgi:thymidylate kinase
MYIAIEGLKGSGKTILVDKLISSLAKKNIDFSVMRPTKADDKNSLIEKIYAKHSFMQHNSFFRAIVYAHRAYVASKKTDWNSRLILGDRSIITSYITRWRRWFNSPYLSVLFVNIMEPFMRCPDVIIFLQVSMEKLKQRINKRGIFDIDSSVERLNKMYSAYNEIRTYKPIKKLCHVKWIYVDGNKKEEDVFDETYRIILNYLDEN